MTAFLMVFVAPSFGGRVELWFEYPSPAACEAGHDAVVGHPMLARQRYEAWACGPAPSPTHGPGIFVIGLGDDAHLRVVTTAAEACERVRRVVRQLVREYTTVSATIGECGA